MNNWRLVTLSFFVSLNSLCSQGLLDELNEDGTDQTYYTEATFKDTRIVNLQSNETTPKNVLHFVILHRFGKINSGFYDLFGLDNADMKMSLDYGITDDITISYARNNFQKTFEGSLKAKILKQSTGYYNMPISISWYSIAMYTNSREFDHTHVQRLSYAHQAIITKKINRNLSVALVPSLVHKNIIDQPYELHDNFVLGLGGRYKVKPRVSLNAEYNLRINPHENDPNYNGLSMGVDIETGGHVFQLHITNSKGMFERSFLTENFGTWTNGDIYFGFNLSRVFNL